MTDKLVEECSEDINGNEIVYNATLNNYEKVCQVLYKMHSIFVIFFISISISSTFVYF